eukprot:CAMPEP_0115735632 /NCGR_PEP_ID=MMETSP0272-20121206/86827_1 /TAXON_ID=71861 /ORGANISM="Scrippsiella trochoidea, Strain CCMP3099" /LENGTH=67 /DNA_ID=CAMNT_0003179759 /DNA_START=910 /DNA_END=1109 /DNA_ORIENTATION=+
MRAFHGPTIGATACSTSAAAGNASIPAKMVVAASLVDTIGFVMQQAMMLFLAIQAAKVAASAQMAAG